MNTTPKKSYHLKCTLSQDVLLGVNSWLDDLYLTGITFYDNGRLDILPTAGKSSRTTLTWTKGMIIDKEAKMASKYEIKEINRTTYIFYELKNGDYVYGGKAPYYYVLKKIE